MTSSCPVPIPWYVGGFCTSWRMQCRRCHERTKRILSPADLILYAIFCRGWSNPVSDEATKKGALQS